MSAATKHFTGYLTETNRFGFNLQLSDHDVVVTHLAPWEVLMSTQGGAAGVMCAYPAINGVPMCGNVDLEWSVLRGDYGVGYGNGCVLHRAHPGRHCVAV